MIFVRSDGDGASPAQTMGGGHEKEHESGYRKSISSDEREVGYPPPRPQGAAAAAGGQGEEQQRPSPSPRQDLTLTRNTSRFDPDADSDEDEEGEEDEDDASSSASEGSPKEKESFRSRITDMLKSLHNWYEDALLWIGDHLNFYRSHLLFFTFFPLIMSGIFYAADDGTHPYVDCLFVCISAICVCGLNPLLMESLSHFQQAILFFSMSIGSASSVSIVTIIIRRHFFKKRFEYMVKTDPRARKRAQDVEAAEEKKKPFHRILHPFAFGSDKISGDAFIGEDNNRFERDPGDSRTQSRTLVPSARNTPNGSRSATPHQQPQKKRKRDKLHVDMIRRLDEPVRVNQMNVGGFLSEKQQRSSTDQDAANDDTTFEVNGVTHDSPATMSFSDSQGLPGGDETTPPSRLDTDTPAVQAQHISIDEVSPRSRLFSTSGGRQPTQTASTDEARQSAATMPHLSSGEIEEEDSAPSSSDENEVSNGQLSRTTSRQLGSRSRRSSDPAIPASRRPSRSERQFKRVRTLDPPKPEHVNSPATSSFPRTQTIEIREPPHPIHHRRDTAHSSALPAYSGGDAIRRRPTGGTGGASFDRTASRRVGEGIPRTLTRDAAMVSGFGGFPNPVKVVASAAQRRLIPKTATSDFNRTTTFQSIHSTGGLSTIGGGPTKEVSYISFDAVVGRNSRFYSLTSAQREELGGVEYRALSALLKILLCYYFFVQLVPIIIFCPLMQSSRYADHFRDQGSITNAGGWYAAFNVISAYSNTGFSLLDESMGPFQETYGFVLWMGFLILAGNTAFPIFLRLIIWTMSNLTPDGSRFKETLQFLLDHPRRCFIYLFPSPQTWILAFVITVLTCIDWVCFIVLDIGNPVIFSLPPAARAIDGLFQAIAVRAAGFSIVSLLQCAAALQVLYVVMMYIAVYPIAMSIRSTNVYEEKALGVYVDHDDDSEIEQQYERQRKTGSFFAHHVRKQLAFDLWWLALALFAITIVEKRNIAEPSTNNYFTVFTIIFELVSAYGTVGLSLGTPNANWSLCGDFRTLSKLILCAVMIRGRHRGLPVAIDRSILLPSDIEAINAKPASDELSQTCIDEDEANADAATAYFGGGKKGDETLKRRQSRRSSIYAAHGSRPTRQASSLSSGSAGGKPSNASLKTHAAGQQQQQQQQSQQQQQQQQSRPIPSAPKTTPTTRPAHSNSISNASIHFAPASPPTRSANLPHHPSVAPANATIPEVSPYGERSSYLSPFESESSASPSPQATPSGENFKGPTADPDQPNASSGQTVASS